MQRSFTAIKINEHIANYWKIILDSQLPLKLISVLGPEHPLRFTLSRILSPEYVDEKAEV